MIPVRLETAAGEYVGTANLPPSPERPRLLRWGVRLFLAVADRPGVRVPIYVEAPIAADLGRVDLVLDTVIANGRILGGTPS